MMGALYTKNSLICFVRQLLVLCADTIGPTFMGGRLEPQPVTLCIILY